MKSQANSLMLCGQTKFQSTPDDFIPSAPPTRAWSRLGHGISGCIITMSHPIIKSEATFRQYQELLWFTLGRVMCGRTRLGEYRCLTRELLDGKYQVCGFWFWSNNSSRESFPFLTEAAEYVSSPAGEVSRQHDVEWGTMQHNWKVVCLPVYVTAIGHR